MAITKWLPTVVLRTRCTWFNTKWKSNYFLECTCGRSGLDYIFNATQYLFSVFNFNSYLNFHFPDLTLIFNGPLRNIKSRPHCTYFGSIKNFFSSSILWFQNTLLLTLEISLYFCQRNVPNTLIQINSKIIFLPIKIFCCEGALPMVKKSSSWIDTALAMKT